MAIELRFYCESETGDYLTAKSSTEEVTITLSDSIGFVGDVHLDITSAIKFAKTLRTEINKAKEGGQDGI